MFPLSYVYGMYFEPDREAISLVEVPRNCLANSENVVVGGGGGSPPPDPGPLSVG